MRGVFETLLVREGRPLELEAHLARLESSLIALFGGPLPPDARALLVERSRGFALGRVRLTVRPDLHRALIAEVHGQAVDPSVVFPPWSRALDLKRLVLAGGLGAHKWADRRLLEAAEAAAAPALPLILDEDASVLEGSRSNLFLVKDGALLTPRADGRILPGVTRTRVLALAAQLGMPCGELAVSVDQLREADEVFLTGSIRGVEPVRHCDGVGEWPEGRITTILSQSLRRLWTSAPAE